MVDPELEGAILRTLEGSPDTIQALVDDLDVPHPRVPQTCQGLHVRGLLVTGPRGYFVVYSLTATGRDRLDGA